MRLKIETVFIGHGRAMAFGNPLGWRSPREVRRILGASHGHKVRGKTLADKRRGYTSHRARSKAVWV